MTDDVMTVRAQIAEAQEREATAKAQITEALILITVSEHASHRSIYDPAAVAKLIDRDMLVIDEDGNPLNVLEAMDTVLKANPLLCDMEHYREARRRQQATLEVQARFRPMRLGPEIYRSGKF